jgi:hypothetical protein
LFQIDAPYEGNAYTNTLADFKGAGSRFRAARTASYMPGTCRDSDMKIGIAETLLKI